ncbi:MAG: AMP-binding protein [Pseudomonadales bacterium]
MHLNYASTIEQMADRLVDSPCLFYGEKTLTWKQYDDRGSRIARALSEAGLKKDSKVGLFLYNCCEYMESTLAAYKLRAIPININYRYVGDELAYLLNDCGAEAIVFHSSLGDVVAEIRDKVSTLKLLISVNDEGELIDGAEEYEHLITSTEPAERIERSAEDLLMLYTGGTTGMPKGVEYKIGEMLGQMVQMSPMYFGNELPVSVNDLLAQAEQRAKDKGYFVSLPASPLMHTAGILNSGMFVQVLGGAMVILTSRSFDPSELWQAVQDHHVQHMVVVGDTFVKPMLRALEEDRDNGIEYDLSSFRTMISSGVIFSQESKLKLLELADMMILDVVGATEGGMAIQMSNRSSPPTETASFVAMETTEIFDEGYNMLPRGCGKPGFIGMGGTLPQGYYKDEAKTAKTFRTIDGQRWGFTGDMGTIESDGTLTFLGRGSGCINTGGEKVYPEEVEEAVKKHPSIADCLVVGLPDDRFGERIAAVVSLKGLMENPTEELMEFCTAHLARYKLPRSVKVVDKVERLPNGKANYKWAKSCFAS